MFHFQLGSVDMFKEQLTLSFTVIRPWIEALEHMGTTETRYKIASCHTRKCLDLFYNRTNLTLECRIGSLDFRAKLNSQVVNLYPVSTVSEIRLTHVLGVFRLMSFFRNKECRYHH